MHQIQHLSYKHSHISASKTVYLLLHGANEGALTGLVAQIYGEITEGGRSVFAFNFPYIDQANGKPSDGLVDEVKSLDEVISYLENQGYNNIVIVAKSLGGIVASKSLGNHTTTTSHITVIILGYVIGDVVTESLKGHLTAVIQGQLDKYGDSQAVSTELKKHSVSADIIEIAGADHSYRDTERAPIYHTHVIEKLLNIPA